MGASRYARCPDRTGTSISGRPRRSRRLRRVGLGERDLGRPRGETASRLGRRPRARSLCGRVRVGSLRSHRSRGADVLVVTNMWPEAERPVYGIPYSGRSSRSVAKACVVTSSTCGDTLGPGLSGCGVRSRVEPRLARPLPPVHAYSGETALAVRFHSGPRFWSPTAATTCSAIRARTVRSAAAPARAWPHPHAGPARSRAPSRSRGDGAAPPVAPSSQRVIPNGRRHGASSRSTGGLPGAPGLGPEEVVAVRGQRSPARPANGAARRAGCACLECGRGRCGCTCRQHHPPDEMPADERADCLLLTSSVEGSPNVVKEALMCNLPVVATRCRRRRQSCSRESSRRGICAAPGSALARRRRRECIAGVRSNGRECRTARRAIARQIVELYRILAASRRVAGEGRRTRRSTPGRRGGHPRCSGQLRRVGDRGRGDREPPRPTGCEWSSTAGAQEHRRRPRVPRDAPSRAAEHSDVQPRHGPPLVPRDAHVLLAQHGRRRPLPRDGQRALPPAVPALAEEGR